MFLLLKSMLMITLCSSTLSRPFTEPSIMNFPRAASPNDLPPAIQNTMCEGGLNATTIDSTTIFGVGITLTIGSCSQPDDAPSIESVENVPVVRPSCPVAANNCASRFGTQFQQGNVGKCGASCSSTCYYGATGPDPNDCEYLIGGMITQQPQLFTLAAYQFLILRHNSCGIGFQNQIAAPSVGSCTQSILYDYQDLGAIARYLAWNCQAAQGAGGGVCKGNSGLYQPSIPDFYAQVFRNS